MWKKSPRTLSDTSEEFAKVHNTSEELKTPRVGGVIIWISVFITVFIIYLISIIFDNPTTLKLNFF
jgi:UDP-N-acetylmuramyl pentapeptide phosphotransferase/UDP-N-acetylglucosamine-1-phosphate transferase